MVALEADVDVDVGVDVTVAGSGACLAPFVNGLEDVVMVTVSSDISGVV